MRPPSSRPLLISQVWVVRDCMMVSGGESCVIVVKLSVQIILLRWRSAVAQRCISSDSDGQATLRGDGITHRCRNIFTSTGFAVQILLYTNLLLKIIAIGPIWTESNDQACRHPTGFHTLADVSQPPPRSPLSCASSRPHIPLIMSASSPTESAAPINCKLLIIGAPGMLSRFRAGRLTRGWRGCVGAWNYRQLERGQVVATSSLHRQAMASRGRV